MSRLAPGQFEKAVQESMEDLIGTGGIPTAAEQFGEFTFRLKVKLGLCASDECSEDVIPGNRFGLCRPCQNAESHG